MSRASVAKGFLYLVVVMDWASRAASPNSCPGTGNRSTPPALVPKPAHSPSAYK
jgi:hypothetical protein